MQRLIPGGQPRWIRAYDNGGETADRFTVVFTGRYTHKTSRQHLFVGMSGSPFHPQGFCQHGESPDQIDLVNNSWSGPSIGRTHPSLGKRIAFRDLPADCQKVVLRDYCDLWDLPSSMPKTAEIQG